MDFVNKHAGVMIEEKDLTGEKLVKTIDSLINDDKILKEMKENLADLGVDDSATRIYELLKKLTGE